MAGRPLRRARLNAMAALNPMLSWHLDYPGTMGSAEYYFGPLLKPGAEEKFKAAVAVSDRVLPTKGVPPLRLSYVIEKNDVADFDRAQELATTTQSLVLFERIFSKQKGLFGPGKPGDSNRVSPYTPFVMFHRLGENIGSSHSDESKPVIHLPWDGMFSRVRLLPAPVGNLWSQGLQMTSDWAVFMETEDGKLPAIEYERMLYCSGLDTQAARLGAFDDGSQAIVDGFAKFCLNKDPLYGETKGLTYKGRPFEIKESYIRTARDASLEQITFAVQKVWHDIVRRTVWSFAYMLSRFILQYYSIDKNDYAEHHQVRWLMSFYGHHYGRWQAPSVTPTNPYDLVDMVFGYKFILPKEGNYIHVEEVQLRRIKEELEAQQAKALPARMEAMHAARKLILPEISKLKQKQPSAKHGTLEAELLREQLEKKASGKQTKRGKAIEDALKLLKSRVDAPVGLVEIMPAD